MKEWVCKNYYLLELEAREGLAKPPLRGSNIEAGESAAIAGGDHERQALPVEVVVDLPILAPIAPHGLPGSCCWASDLDCLDVAATAHVGDEHQVEVLVAI